MNPFESILGKETHEAEVYGKLENLWGWHPLGRGTEEDCAELCRGAWATTGASTRVSRAFERTTLRSFIHKLTEKGVVVRLDETALYIMRHDGDKPCGAYIAPRVTVGDRSGVVEFRFNMDKLVNTSPHCYLVPMRGREDVLCLVMGSP